MRTPADRAHRASSRKYPSVRESLACRSCQTAYCRIATPGIPPPRVTSPHGAQAQSDSLVVADVLTGSADETARLWDAATGREITAFRGHEGPVYSVAFSPDGRRMLTGSYD